MSISGKERKPVRVEIAAAAPGEVEVKRTEVVVFQDRVEHVQERMKTMHDEHGFKVKDVRRVQ